MADLSPFADRLNDVEINNNAPVTSTLMRRLGQNINFLLDLLNITDGSNTPSGGGFTEYTTAGAHSFVVDPGLNRIYYVLVGGGGGGGKGGGATGGNGGGGGGYLDGYSVFTVGETININIGTGGLGSTGGPVSAGSNGGDSTLSSIAHNLTAIGGRGGAGSGATRATGGWLGTWIANPSNGEVISGTNSGGINTLSAGSGAIINTMGANTKYNNGGQRGSSSTQSGGGGGASYGPGGTGGAGPSGAPSNGSYGGGGGGSSAGSNGGNGGTGVCRIFIPLTT